MNLVIHSLVAFFWMAISVYHVGTDRFFFCHIIAILWIVVGELREIRSNINKGE